MSKIRESIKKMYEDDEYESKSDYTVLYGDYGHYDVNDPRKAVAVWFQKEKVNRGDAAIIAYSKDKAKSLMQWAYNNKDMIKEWHAKYDCPYKLDYILSSIDKHSTDEYKYFHEGPGGDQVDPFSFG